MTDFLHTTATSILKVLLYQVFDPIRRVMVKNYVNYAFNGGSMCFMHLLLHVLDMDSKGSEARIIIEVEAVKKVKDLKTGDNTLPII